MLLLSDFCTVAFQTSLYSILKLWFTLLAPIAPFGFAAKMFVIVSVGVPVALLTVLFKKKGMFSARF